AVRPFDQPQRHPGGIVQSEELQFARRPDPVQVQVQGPPSPGQLVGLDQGVSGAADRSRHPERAQPGARQGRLARTQVTVQEHDGTAGLGRGKCGTQARGGVAVGEVQAGARAHPGFASNCSCGNRSTGSRPRMAVAAAAASPAAACSKAPQAAASKASRPCARSAAMAPVSRSPMPPVAIPGLPASIRAMRPSGAATRVPAPFSTTTASKLLARARADASRPSWTSAVVMPISRAASPGCGVRIASPTARGCSASRFSASASSTIGFAVPRAACSNPRAQSPRPSPGPIATTVARSSSGAKASPESTACAIASGWRASSAATCSARVATLTRPAPQRNAACAHSTIAPPLPRSPPTHSTCPWSPLWLSRARGRSQRASSAGRKTTGCRSGACIARFYTCAVERTAPDRPALDQPALAALAQRLKALASDAGFQRVGISGVELGDDERHLRDWLAQGLHGSMQWMARHGDKRSRPSELLPGTLRVLSVGMDYGREPEEAWANLRDHERAYVARYALGRDYHKLMRQRLQRLADEVAKEIGPFGFRVFVDSAPVLERALARNAGLGWIGKHTCLIDKDGGSWFFLGEIYLDLPLPVDAPGGNHCG